MRDMAYIVLQYILLTGFVVGWTISMEFLIARVD